MTVYLSAHYNLSRFRGAITKDHIRRYQQVIDWFTSEPKLKGTISFNSFFLQSIIWENESIIKDISKLCLSGQVELSSSMYSSFVPFNLPSEENMIRFQIKEASRILKDIYPKKYIKGYYPPFSVCDDRSIRYLLEEDILYMIVDWFVLDKILHREPIGDIHPRFSKPFKVKNHEIYVLPSYNLRTIYRLYPEMYKEYLSSGIIDGILETIRAGVKISKEQSIDLFGIQTIDLNDLKFPNFRSDFDFSNYFNESKKLVDQKVVFIKPSEVIEKFEVEEIELKHSLPYEMSLSNNMQDIFNLTPSCKRILKSFKLASKTIEKNQEVTDLFSNKKKEVAVNLLKYSRNFLAKTYHNICFGSFNEPLKGINILSVENIWRSITHLNLVDMVFNSIFSESYIENNDCICTSEEDCGDLIHSNNFLVCSFLQKGGIINNLVNKQYGEFIVSSPSQQQRIKQHSMEPQFGLLFDVVSKKYSGQYNLFNEGYILNCKKQEDLTEICLSIFATGDILLRKYCTFKHNSKTIEIRYEFENTGLEKEEFSIHSISKFNLGDFLIPVFSKRDLLSTVKTEKNYAKTLSISNKKTSSIVKIFLPENIDYHISKSFRNIELTLSMKIPILQFGEKKEYQFHMTIE